jgi:hypothetical protein
MAEGKKLRKLRLAVNDYLYSQNQQGYKDAPHGDKDRCREAREHLCHVVYKLNEAASDSEES